MLLQRLSFTSHPGGNQVDGLPPARNNRAQPGLAHFRIFDIFDRKINFKYDLHSEISFIQNIQIFIKIYLDKVSEYGVIQSEISE